MVSNELIKKAVMYQNLQGRITLNLSGLFSFFSSFGILRYNFTWVLIFYIGDLRLTKGLRKNLVLITKNLKNGDDLSHEKI